METPVSGEIRGNRNSNIYHLENCPGFDRMSRKNIVVFETEVAASNAGYRIAKNCPDLWLPLCRLCLAFRIVPGHDQES